MHRARSTAVVVGLITALWAGVLACWLELTPVYRAPDEPQHVDLVLHVLHGGGWERPGTLAVSPQVQGSLRAARLASGGPTPLHVPMPEQPVPYVEAPPPAFDQPLRDLQPLAGSGTLVNQQTQQPPLYYATVALAMRAVPGVDTLSLRRTVGVMRGISAALLLPLPGLAFATAARLGARRRICAAAALLPLGDPQLAHIGASVNNDALLVLLGAAVAVPLAAVARGDVSARTAAWVGGLLGLAALTKSLALAVIVLAVVSYVAACLGPLRRQWRAVVRAAAVASGVAAAVSGWWLVRNEVLYGSLQPEGLALPGHRPDATFGRFVATVPVSLVRSSWGRFGWLEVDAPLWLALGGTAVVVVGLGLALSRPRQDLFRAAAATALALVAQLGVVLLLTLRQYVRHGFLVGLQGRYLFPLAASVAAVVAVGLARVVPPRWLALLALVAAGVAQAVGAHSALTGFWGGGTQGLRLVRAWLPLPGEVALGAAVVVGLAGALLLLVLAGWRDEDRDPVPAH